MIVGCLIMAIKKWVCGSGPCEIHRPCMERRICGLRYTGVKSTNLALTKTCSRIISERANNANLEACRKKPCGHRPHCCDTTPRILFLPVENTGSMLQWLSEASLAVPWITQFRVSATQSLLVGTMDSLITTRRWCEPLKMN